MVVNLDRTSLDALFTLNNNTTSYPVFVTNFIINGIDIGSIYLPYQNGDIATNTYFYVNGIDLNHLMQKKGVIDTTPTPQGNLGG